MPEFDEAYGLRWRKGDRGDEYILKESSYRCLFDPKQQPQSLRPNDIWMDVGAHIGTFAIRASQYVKRVVAVEPSPESLDRLRENITLNWISNVTVVPGAAIADSDMKVNLALGRTFNYTDRIGHIRGRQNVEVQGYNINNLVLEYGVNKIKMDCEGLEQDLLANLNFNPIQEIILEWHFTLIPDPDWSKLRLALEWFQQEGFELLKVPKNLDQPTKRWTAIIWAKRA